MNASATPRSASREVRAAQRRRSRGFTLTELMVAITGGLFVAVAVFALARDGSRFYQRESRVANATFANFSGFQRLRTDLARASYMASPNLRADGRLCGNVNSGTWPTLLQNLAGIRITRRGSPVNADLTANNLNPDQVLISGSFSSADQFPIRAVQLGGNNTIFYLQTDTEEIARLGYYTAGANQAQVLTDVFGAGRGLRFVDKSGDHYYGTITGVVAGAQPQVLIAGQPAIPIQQGATCGVTSLETGGLINVINFVQYDVRNLNTNSNFGGANASYAPLYAAATSVPFDANRTELVRVELDTQGQPIAGTEEVAAEYAVDLKFGITVAQGFLNGTDPNLLHLPFDSGQIATWAGITTGVTPPQGPQKVRSVRARLSVRSREPDRLGDVVAGAGVAPGLYRFALTVNGTTQFARVRTIQADVALHNHSGVSW